MDRPPSFPHHQNPYPNFFHQPPPPNPNLSFYFRPPPPPPIQNPNTHSIPPLIHDLSGTLSSLQSLLSESQRTLDLSENLALDHSSLLQKDDFFRCPFDPNHLMPPEALFLHSLRCPNPLDLTHLLGSFSSYRNKLELHCEELQLSDSNGDLCFSLDDLADVGKNFFYRECPGVVNFSELDGKKRTFTLPSVLSVECSDFDEEDDKSMLEKCCLGILPSDFCAMKSEVDQWRDYPSSYSFRVLWSFLGLNLTELSTWILVNSTRYGVIIDTYMRDHIYVLFRLSLKAVVKEACGFTKESDANGAGEVQITSCKRRTFECPVLVRVLSWLASQLGILYGEGNGKFFALDIFKQCIVESASRIMLFRSERTRAESSGILENLDGANVSNKMEKPFENNSGGEVGKSLDSVQVISVSRVAAAVAALYERSVLEGKIRAIRYPQPLTRYQRVAELGIMTARADEERKKRSNYRAIIDHDGLPRQRASNEEMNKLKTKEELLAEERDYKRRRMSYRGKKLKRTPREVLRDIIEEYTEEIKLAGGIGCFEKGMPLPSSSSIGNNQKESDIGYNNTTSSTISDASPRFNKQWKGENRADTEYPVEIRTKTDKGKPYEENDSHSGSSQRQQSYHRSHRSYKHNDRRDERYSPERKSHHRNHKSSHGKSSSDYNTKRDDLYDRRSRGSRNQNSFEDRYNPLEKE